MRRPISLSIALAAIVATSAACSTSADEAVTTAPPTTTVTSASPTASTGAPEPTTSPTDAAGFDLGAITADFVGEAQGGAAVLIVRDGTTTRAAVGMANGADALTADTPMRAGSISKTFVAVMVLQLVDEGVVDLEEPLGTYLPDTPLGANVTIRALLGHDSGIPSYTDQPGFLIDALADRDRSFSRDEVLAYVTEVTAEEAGAFSYSNTNYILLGMLVERVTGQELDEVLQQRIARPLGLEATVFASGDVAAPSTLAAGWSLTAGAGDASSSYESFASGAWAAGAIVSTTDDLATFMTALFAGELMSEASLAEMTAVEGDGYGLGLLAASLGDGRPAFAHNGSIPGYSATMAISPETGDLLVILTNNDMLVADLLAPEILESW